jgi:class 3 adenylate cyclase
MNLLQAVHEEIGRLAASHGGTIGFRAGDGVMVIFNDPLPCPDPVKRAVSLARDINATFAEIRKRWRDLGHRIGMGIGISYGYATLGLIGTEGRRDYTAIGNAVNIAARLCDQAEDGAILLEKRAYLEVEGDIPCEASGQFALKGLSKDVEVFRVARPPEAP